VLTAVRVVGQQQDASSGRQHEYDADKRFLDFGPAPVSPVQDPCGDECSADGRDLHHEATCFPPHCVRGDNAESCDLSDREVDEDNAAAQDFLPERHVRTQHQQTGKECRDDDAEFESGH
jgi:hypothetical protein